MRELLAVGAGGVLGAVLRYLVATTVQKAAAPWSFPIGTVVVNLFGCLVFGFLGQYAEQTRIIPRHVHVLLMVGLLGSFTTFSTFGYDCLVLIRESRLVAAMCNAGVQVLGGVLSVFLGTVLARAVARVG